MKKAFLIVSGCLIALAAIAVTITIVTVEYHSKHVVLNSVAMQPTIRNGQHLILQKYESSAQVKRGDIIDYSSHVQIVQKYSKSGNLVHRVIALPGERIAVKDGNVLVYNTEHPNGFNPDASLNLKTQTPGSVDTTVALGQFFVMGDNRPNSLDSRAIGTIPFADIIGKVNQ